MTNQYSGTLVTYLSAVGSSTCSSVLELGRISTVLTTLSEHVLCPPRAGCTHFVYTMSRRSGVGCMNWNNHDLMTILYVAL